MSDNLKEISELYQTCVKQIFNDDQSGFKYTIPKIPRHISYNIEFKITTEQLASILNISESSIIKHVKDEKATNYYIQLIPNKDKSPINKDKSPINKEVNTIGLIPRYLDDKDRLSLFKEPLDSTAPFFMSKHFKPTVKTFANKWLLYSCSEETIEDHIKSDEYIKDYSSAHIICICEIPIDSNIEEYLLVFMDIKGKINFFGGTKDSTDIDVKSKLNPFVTAFREFNEELNPKKATIEDFINKLQERVNKTKANNKSPSKHVEKKQKIDTIAKSIPGISDDTIKNVHRLLREASEKTISDAAEDPAKIVDNLKYKRGVYSPDDILCDILSKNIMHDMNGLNLEDKKEFTPTLLERKFNIYILHNYDEPIDTLFTNYYKSEIKNASTTQRKKKIMPFNKVLSYFFHGSVLNNFYYTFFRFLQENDIFLLIQGIKNCKPFTNTGSDFTHYKTLYTDAWTKLNNKIEADTTSDTKGITFEHQEYTFEPFILLLLKILFHTKENNSFFQLSDVRKKDDSTFALKINFKVHNGLTYTITIDAFSKSTFRWAQTAFYNLSFSANFPLLNPEKFNYEGTNIEVKMSPPNTLTIVNFQHSNTNCIDLIFQAVNLQEFKLSVLTELYKQDLNTDFKAAPKTIIELIKKTAKENFDKNWMTQWSDAKFEYFRFISELKTFNTNVLQLHLIPSKSTTLPNDNNELVKYFFNNLFSFKLLFEASHSTNYHNRAMQYLEVGKQPEYQKIVLFMTLTFISNILFYQLFSLHQQSEYSFDDNDDHDLDVKDSSSFVNGKIKVVDAVRNRLLEINEGTTPTLPPNPQSITDLYKDQIQKDTLSFEQYEKNQDDADATSSLTKISKVPYYGLPLQSIEWGATASNDIGTDDTGDPNKNKNKNKITFKAFYYSIDATCRLQFNTPNNLAMLKVGEKLLDKRTFPRQPNTFGPTILSQNQYFIITTYNMGTSITPSIFYKQLFIESDVLLLQEVNIKYFIEKLEDFTLATSSNKLGISIALDKKYIKEKLELADENKLQIKRFVAGGQEFYAFKCINRIPKKNIQTAEDKIRKFNLILIKKTPNIIEDSFEGYIFQVSEITQFTWVHLILAIKFDLRLPNGNSIKVCFINVHFDTDLSKDIQHTELQYLIYSAISTKVFFDDVSLIFIGGDFNLETDEIANIITNPTFFDNIYFTDKKKSHYIYHRVNEKYNFEILNNNFITRHHFKYDSKSKAQGSGLDNMILLTSKFLTLEQKQSILMLLGFNRTSGDVETPFDETILEDNILAQKQFIIDEINSIELSSTTSTDTIYKELKTNAANKESDPFKNLKNLKRHLQSDTQLDVDKLKFIRKTIYSDHSPLTFCIPRTVLQEHTFDLNLKLEKLQSSTTEEIVYKYNYDSFDMRKKAKTWDGQQFQTDHISSFTLKPHTILTNIFTRYIVEKISASYRLNPSLSKLSGYELFTSPSTGGSSVSQLKSKKPSISSKSGSNNVITINNKITDKQLFIKNQIKNTKEKLKANPNIKYIAKIDKLTEQLKQLKNKQKQMVIKQQIKDTKYEMKINPNNKQKYITKIDKLTEKLQDIVII